SRTWRHTPVRCSRNSHGISAATSLKTCTILQPARLRIDPPSRRERAYGLARSNSEGGVRMRITRSRVAGGVALVAMGSLAAVAAGVQAASPSFTPVPSAQTKAVGISVPNALPPELADIVVAQGSNVIENPDA